MKLRRFFKHYWKFMITLLVVSSVAMGFIYKLHQPPPSLPVYAPNMVDESLVDPTVQYVRNHHVIPDFQLINQNGDTITQANYEGKIYVADFFYTTCPSFCTELTESFLQLQEKLKDDDEVMLLSHTVTPEIDTPEQLKRYAVQKGVHDDKWNLVTGSKKEIYDLARKSYCVVKEGTDEGIESGGKYDMIHTENLVLIDKQKRIRGYYDGTDAQEIKRLLKDIKTLHQIEKLAVNP